MIVQYKVLLDMSWYGNTLQKFLLQVNSDLEEIQTPPPKTTTTTTTSKNLTLTSADSNTSKNTTQTNKLYRISRQPHLSQLRVVCMCVCVCVGGGFSGVFSSFCLFCIYSNDVTMSAINFFSLRPCRTAPHEQLSRESSCLAIPPPCGCSQFPCGRFWRPVSIFLGFLRTYYFPYLAVIKNACAGLFGRRSK